MDNERKRILIENQIRKAKDTIIDAKIAFENDRFRNTLNRNYYAIFYIVTALAYKYDFITSKHKQLMGWFNKNFIKDNILDRKLGEIYKIAFDNRQDSDYSDFFAYDKNIIEEHFKDMLYFVSEIEKFINQE